MYHKIFCMFKGMNASIALKSSLRFPEILPYVPAPFLKQLLNCCLPVLHWITSLNYIATDESTLIHWRVRHEDGKGICRKQRAVLGGTGDIGAQE